MYYPSIRWDLLNGTRNGFGLVMTFWNVIHENKPVLTQRTREQALNFVSEYYSAFEQVAVNVWQLKIGDEVISTLRMEQCK